MGYREREDAAREVVGGIEGAGGVALGVALDVGAPESVDAAIGIVERDLGPVAALVNNAGIAQEAPFEELTDADWERMLSVNLLGAVRCVRAVLPGMLERNWGRLVQISSIGGQWGGRNQVHYAASKAALINFTRSMSNLYAERGVTSNAIAPGLVATEMSGAELGTEAGKTKVRGIPLGRLGTVDEIGATAAYLCSDDAAYVSGQTFNANGGMYG